MNNYFKYIILATIGVIIFYACKDEVNYIKVTSITLDKKTITLHSVGEAETLVATVLPDNATNKSVTFESSRTTIATVKSNGLVTAISAGTTTITVTTEDGSHSETCEVKVIEKKTIAVTGVSLNKNQLSLNVGEKETIKAIVEPDDADNKKVTWESSNNAIATVLNGVVSAITTGSATITVTTVDGGYSETCEIVVIAKVQNISLNKTKLILASGNKETLIAIFNPPNTTNKEVTWSSDKPEIAIVNNAGEVTALSTGAATICVTTNDGGHTATCFVMVNPVTMKIETNFNQDPRSISLAGSGKVTIDWGDGSNIETYTLQSNEVSYTHRYSDMNSRTILIIGEKITKMDCCKNYLTSLDINNNTTLTYLDCSFNRLTNLNVSTNTALTKLICRFNYSISSLNVSNNIALTYLDCSFNSLTSLNVSNIIGLTYLDCLNNRLTSLNVDNNTALKYIDCSTNRLTSLNVSNNKVLEQLWCSSNQLSNLDLSKNKSLNLVNCNLNNFARTDLNDLFETLHSNNVEMTKYIYIFSNPGTNNCDISIATNKGWTVYN